MENKSTKETKIRCSKCNKKCNMIHFTCRCGKILCITHQLPHNHDCQFNNKQKCKQILKDKNPKVNTGTLVKV
jgi:hypothetical protein